MNNRQRVIEAIGIANAKLRNEIHYHFYEVEHENESYDMADALEDTASLIESEDTPLPKILLYDFYIHIGYAVEIDITRVTSTGKKYWFKRFGKHYDPIEGWESWIQK